MITIDGTEYHLVEASQDSCAPDGFPRCHFIHHDDCSLSGRKKCCSPTRGAPHPAIFMSQKTYIEHIAARLKS